MTKELFQQICLRYLGIPYLWGGSSALTGYDCSGLAQELLAILGLDPQGDQNAEALRQYFLKTGALGLLDTGSLIFYGSNNVANHVGIILQAPYMIEAAPGGHEVVDLKTAAEKDARVRIRPYTRRSDVISIIQPSNLPWASQPQQSSQRNPVGLPSFQVR